MAIKKTTTSAVPKPIRKQIKAKKQANKQAIKTEAKQARVNKKQEKINAKLNMSSEEFKQNRAKRRTTAAAIGAAGAAAIGAVASQVRGARLRRGYDKWKSENPRESSSNVPSQSELRKMGRKNKLF